LGVCFGQEETLAIYSLTSAFGTNQTDAIYYVSLEKFDCMPYLNWKESIAAGVDARKDDTLQNHLLLVNLN